MLQGWKEGGKKGGKLGDICNTVNNTSILNSKNSAPLFIQFFSTETSSSFKGLLPLSPPKMGFVESILKIRGLFSKFFFSKSKSL